MDIQTNCGTGFCITLCDNSGEEIDGYTGDVLNPADLKILAEKIEKGEELNCFVDLSID